MKNWFKTVRASNISVSSVLSREKALNVADKLSIENFSRLMVGLIDSKSVTILFSKVVYGEGNAVLEESVREWQEGKLKDHAKEYSLKDIFNIDETGLFCVLPNKTFTFKGENCHGGKNSKLRLNVMLGADADGSEKL